MTKLLEQLTKRGDKVAIVNGRLVIEPASGKPVPKDWLSKHWRQLVEEITSNENRRAYQYIDYSTGSFHNGRAKGVRLVFMDVGTGENYPVYYNAALEYLRNGVGYKKGDPLPKGQFNIGKQSAFVKFWMSAFGGLPRGRVSDFHKYMGNLNKLVFAAKLSLSKQSQLDKNSLILFESIHASSAEHADFQRQTSDNAATNQRHRSDKVSDKQTQQNQTQQGLHGNLSAGELPRIKKLSNDVLTEGLSPSNNILLECDNSFNTQTNIRPQEQTVDEWLADHDTKFTQWNGYEIK